MYKKKKHTCKSHHRKCTNSFGKKETCKNRDHNSQCYSYPEKTNSTSNDNAFECAAIIKQYGFVHSKQPVSCYSRSKQESTTTFTKLNCFTITVLNNENKQRQNVCNKNNLCKT